MTFDEWLDFVPPLVPTGSIPATARKGEPLEIDWPWDDEDEEGFAFWEAASDRAWLTWLEMEKDL